MARILVARPDRHTTTIFGLPWSVENGPIHLAIAHALVAHDRRDWIAVARGPLGGITMVGSAVATMTAPARQGPGIAEAQVEGPLAFGLARLDLDAIVFVGRSETPQGLRLSGRGDTAWGEWISAAGNETLSVWDKDLLVRASPTDVILTTGPLGMATHRAASIVVNRGFPTTQGGLGAVFGYLGLDHVLLRGDRSLPPQSALHREVTRGYEENIAGNPLTASERNNPGFAMWPGPDLVGYAASPGFSGKSSQAADTFDPGAMMAFLADSGDGACPGCPQWCLKSFTATPDVPIDGGRAHQLGVGAMVLMLDMSDPETLVRFNSLCHELGIEHLRAVDALRGRSTTGATLASDLIEALEDDRSPAQPSFHVKGMVVPPFDPRGNQGLGVGYALNPTGPRYDVLEHDIDFEAGQPWLGREHLERDFGMPATGLPLGTLDDRRQAGLATLWLAWSGLDALGLCEFAAPPTRELTIEAICSVMSEKTGHPFGRDDFFHAGRVRLGMLRHINSLLGVSAADDTLPEHFFHQPVVDGRMEGVIINRDDFLSACQKVRGELGWDEVGGVADDTLLATINHASGLVWKNLEGIVS